jgi:DNA-binding transcriptional LysR family regulator
MIYYLDYYKSMEIHQVECFLAVIETGSFRAASEKLNKAQSAVSTAIKNLEEELGILLFDRSQYRPTLTAQGENIWPQLVSFQQQISTIQKQAYFMKQGFEPKITLAVSALWPEKNLSDFVQKFTDQFPFTELIIKQEVLSADEILRSEEADIAISKIFDESDLFEKRDIGFVDMVAVASRSHPLFKIKKQLSPQKLIEYRQIILKNTSQESKRNAGIEPGQPQIGVYSLSLKKQLILCGVGWGNLPSHMIEKELQSKHLFILKQPHDRIPAQLAWLKKKNLGPCARFIISAFAGS